MVDRMAKEIGQIIPGHVGIILDGNRRWAKSKGKPTLEGHRQGSEVFREIALHAFDRGVKCMSAFGFSTENWNRTKEEVSYLMKLVVKVTEKYLDEFGERGVKILILGRREGLAKNVLGAIKRAEEATKSNTKGTLAICFNYGGQAEIVDAVKKLIAEGIPPQEVTADVVSGALYHPEVPDIDLLIRTSGEMRTSGFMLYRVAYAELYFNNKYWPDFTREDLDAAFAEYAKRSRRFGN
jgi:undecaprenyl diphosphate synthase